MSLLKKLDKKRIILSLGLIVSAFPVMAEGEEWEGIVPLRSNRIDVEKKLGPCKDGHPWICSYKGKDRSVVVSYYTKEECKSGGVYKVTAGTVMAISVYPEKQTRFDRSNFPPAEYIEEADSELVGISYFINERTGIIVAVDRGFIRSYDYYPTKKDKGTFSCRQ